MILKKKVFGSAMLAAAIMSAGTCTAMATHSRKIQQSRQRVRTPPRLRQDWH